MPTPTIPKGNVYFDVVLRNGSSGPYATTVDMAQGALLWDKTRSSSGNHNLIDSVRGISQNIQSNNTNAEGTDPTFITAFSNGSFTTGAGDYGSGTSLVDWIWKAGGAAVTNTAGTISSQVSANTTSGFSVVTYTGNGTNGATVGHGLGVAPRMLIVKNRTTGSTLWSVYHASVGASSVAHLNDSAAFSASGDWNSTTPTSTVFTIGTSNRVNTNTDNYVAYCWTPIAGYSAFGSYTGNGSTDGTFVYTGFRPRFLLLKSSSTTNSWAMYDTSRSTYNTSTARLYADTSAAETTGLQIDILSNGFKWRESGGQGNDSGQTYIYMAFCENPLKYANAR
jgi:hypothetical protein